MGLFSSKHVYTAHAGGSQLFDEDTREDTVKSLMLQASIGGHSSLAEAIKLGLQTNMYARAKKMIKYALRPDGYVYGLPETTHNSIHVEYVDIIDAIEGVIGEPIKLIYANWGFLPQDWMLVNERIDATYLDPAYFPWPIGNPVVTDWEERNPSVEIPVEDPSNPGTYYYATNPPSYVAGPGSQYTVTFSYTDSGGNPATWVVPQTYDLSQYQTGDWVWVTYETLANPGVTLYFIYPIGSGALPGFEDAIQISSLDFQYLPIAVLMHDRVWFDEENWPELEETTKKLLKRISLDPYEIKEEYIQGVLDAIADGTRPGTGELDDWDFFIHFSVPMISKIRGSQEYIWHFLQFLQDEVDWTTRQDYETFLNSGQVGLQPQSAFAITEGVPITGYKIHYAWSYITVVTYPGQYTPQGGVPMLPKRMHSDLYEYGTAGYSDGIIEVHGTGAAIANSQPDGQYHDYVVFTRQHLDENDVYTYTQVLMMAPTMMYVINTQDGIQYVDAPLFPEDPEVVSEWKFPVAIGSMRDTSTMHREEMLQDALSATSFLVEHTKVKWYQKTFFKWLIVIIVIVVAILTYQYQLLGTISNLAATALAAGATGSAIALYALYTVMVFALGFLISFAGSLIGGKWGMIFVIVATLYMMGGNPFSNIGASWGNLVSGPGWGTAISFINAVQPVMEIGQLIYQDIALGKLEADMRDFMLTKKEKYQELQDAWDAFGPAPSWLDPMDLVAAFSASKYIESPDGFLARSLNPNPGVLGYDLINDFSEIALLLPDNGNEANVLEIMFEEMDKQRGMT